MQEIQSRKSMAVSQRRLFKTSAKLLYMGKFLNFWRENQWEADKKKVAIDKFNKWAQKTTWYMNNVKGGVQAFTSQLGVDLSVSKIINEDNLRKIKENKMEPLKTPRNMAPAFLIVGIGMAGLAATCPEVMSLPVEAQAVLAGVVILLAISSELHKSQVDSVYREAMVQFGKGIEPIALPKQFDLKLITEIVATPAEFADALTEELLRPLWEPSLKSIKKKSKTSPLLIEYIGVTSPKEVSYDFETMPIKQMYKSTLNSFVVHELCVSEKGLQKASTIYHVEEIANRPGVLKITYYCLVFSEDEARDKLKRMVSLKTYLNFADRKGVPVGSLDEINAKAKGFALGEDDVITEEDDDSFIDNDIVSVAGEIDQFG